MIRSAFHPANHPRGRDVQLFSLYQLRSDLTEAELDDILSQAGPSDRTQVTLVREAGSCVVTIEVPWETSVAVDVARKINGSTFRGQTLNVHATAMF